jgi:26S proteasome regulatory subunit N1
VSAYAATLTSLSDLIRSSTTTMTSVPKPLKFLRPHFGELATAFEALMDDGSHVKVREALIMHGVAGAGVALDRRMEWFC